MTARRRPPWSKERAELERQGAKAAARGDDAASNPLEDSANLPSTTGERAAAWSQRRDAWLGGFRARPRYEARAAAATEPAPPSHPSATPQPAAMAAFELRYDSLNGGPSLVFPCNAEGQVDVDNLGERARANYLLARALVGRDYGQPVVRACG